jgi:hypothetical protein
VCRTERSRSPRLRYRSPSATAIPRGIPRGGSDETLDVRDEVAQQGGRTRAAAIWGCLDNEGCSR